MTQPEFTAALESLTAQAAADGLSDEAMIAALEEFIAAMRESLT